MENIGLLLAASKLFLIYRKSRVIGKALEVSEQQNPCNIRSRLYLTGLPQLSSTDHDSEGV